MKQPLGKFREWLNENCPDANTFLLMEGKPVTDIKNTFNALSKNPDKLALLNKLLGIDGVIPKEAEAGNLLSQGVPQINVFFKTADSQSLNFAAAASADVFAILKKARLQPQYDGKNIVITFSDGKTFWLRETGSAIKADVGKDGEQVVSKYFNKKFLTPIQESIFAAILQAKAEKNKFEPGSVPEEIITLIGKKKYDKFSKFQKWMIGSVPSRNSGLCKYIDFGVAEGDDLAFMKEFSMFLIRGQSNPWIKSFDALNNSDILNEIASVFRNGVSNWTAAHFLHFMSMIGERTFKGTFVEQYLTVNRCGKKKDVVDKADIFLCFNQGVAQSAVEELLHSKSVEEYVTKMNTFINSKDFIGISLKKVGGAVNLSAVNFKTGTTAQGENINDAKKICFKFFKPNDKKNTLDFQHAEIRSPGLQDDKGEFKKGFEIRIPFMPGNMKHILPHGGGENSCALIRVGSNKSGEYNVMVEGKLYPAEAALGKLATPLKEGGDNGFGYDATETFNKLAARCKTPEDFAKAYLKIATTIIQLFKSDEEKAYRTLAIGAGYPLQIGPEADGNFVINSAPYIKIY